MIEIPESKALAEQVKKALIGKRVKKIYTPTSTHKFCFFNGLPESYNGILKGASITSAHGHGTFLDLNFEDVTLTINDGTNMRYVKNPLEMPKKYQLLIEFDDASALVFNVAMYGGILLFKGSFDNVYYQGSLNSISPLCERFDDKYFDNLINGCKKNLSAKAFLATEQRIPGLGNGSLQDILLTCGIHPKRKMITLTDYEKGELFYSVKAVLADMSTKGGRDTERDLFGNFGGYKTMLSKNNRLCALCGDKIIKENYLGGSIYYCPTCQKLHTEVF